MGKSSFYPDDAVATSQQKTEKGMLAPSQAEAVIESQLHPSFFQRLGGALSAFWRACTSNKKVAIGCVVVFFFILVGLIGPMLIQGDPNAVSHNANQAPSAQYWLGTDATGRDLFKQLIAGTRTSVFMSLATGALVTLFSILVGVVGGYFGGLVDDLLTLLTNVFLVLPSLPLAIVLASYFPRNELTVALVIAFTNWAWGARVLRSVTLTMRGRDFVTAARASGESTWRIIFFEVLPNQLSIIAASFVSTTVFVIVFSASLDFLGLGDPSNASWGGMLQLAYKSNALMLQQWWWFVPPGLCVALLGAGLSLINFGIDEIADPRLRSEPVPKELKRRKVIV
ncbi:peptide/nickel transport system permease protein [Thermosporothrix hazakensis]|jgi:peptide/nickel transport system permease protein|uniref:Peptide/nickel transport system permease protein n=2 Tax=Thermosporothrix TaxID=768650 RepID=A0A326UF59_THEHA|nr:ABC transporter permease [Thermosporothrix hazakensis]PZW36511.1 peptide/nickel transport system permease protein [Thermosporothrix hazakensis]BBH88978.1 peptide ABC transporter permease [Thermosporothrix sp. COM3]GCE47164.1 peptide ABC transporter permease [Thermosporothrix hazakensis]